MWSLLSVEFIVFCVSHRTVWYTGTDVSGKPGASIFHFEDELKIAWKEVIVA
jgi:hypothetical protein